MLAVVVVAQRPQPRQVVQAVPVVVVTVRDQAHQRPTEPQARLTPEAAVVVAHGQTAQAPTDLQAAPASSFSRLTSHENLSTDGH